MAAVRDTDRGYAALRARIDDAATLRVLVGVLAEAGAVPHGDDGALTLLEVAVIHEFGAPAAGIPMRSFVRAYVDENRAEIDGWRAGLAGQVIAAKLTPRQALEQLGAKIAGGMQARIARGIAPANAASTVAAKGSDKPLVDEGQLRGAIAHAVRREGA